MFQHCNKVLLKTQHLKKLTKINSKAIISWYSTNVKDEEYDIVVCGSGMIGTAMSSALGKSKYLEGMKVLMLDSGDKPDVSLLENPGNFKIRCCAISPGTIDYLSSLNIWQHVPRSQRVDKMLVWDACSEASISFDDHIKFRNKNGICSITENDLLVAAAMKSLQDTNVHTKFNTKIVDCSIPENNDLQKLAQLKLSDESTISARLVIAADGLNSFLSKKAEIPKMGWEYGGRAVVATLKFSEPCDNYVSWQRFLPSGPIAMLPLDAQHSSLVWATSIDEAKHLCSIPQDELSMKINDAFWKTYEQNELVSQVNEKIQQAISTITQDSEAKVQQFPPSVEKVLGPALSFPLGLSHSLWYVRNRVAFIGDTVHRMHPLAGQGANSGYRDVQNLMKCIENSVYQGKDIGSISSLKQYESDGQFTNVPFLMVTDALHRLYSTDAWPVVLARSSGLQITNALPKLKELLMKKAMS